MLKHLQKETAKVPSVPSTGAGVKYVILTKVPRHTPKFHIGWYAPLVLHIFSLITIRCFQVGEGPQVLDDSESLLDDKGQPKSIAAKS